ncbi:hypothetical protein [Phosphitispora sp. TUW77]|uniref:hypothetical protein n=1 Tax=Phosphitispora sp. TUW77 TaxID=3152361 RepID=UPI003AB859EF
MANQNSNEGTGSLMSFIKPLIITIVLIALCAGLYGGLMVLNILTVWLGFAYVWYFASVKHFQFSSFLTTFIGGLVGVLIVYAMPFLSLYMGLNGQIIWLVLLILLITFVIQGRTKYLNDFTMLIITIFSIPHLAKPEEFTMALITYAIFAVLLGVPSYIMYRKTNKAIQSTGM